MQTGVRKKRPVQGSQSKLEESFNHVWCKLLNYDQIYPPVRQLAPIPKRKNTVDFAWPDLKVIVEIEGGIFHQGRHNRAKGYMDDCKKYNTLTMLGWKLLRYCPPDVNTLSKAVETCMEVKRFLDEEAAKKG